MAARMSSASRDGRALASLGLSLLILAVLTALSVVIFRGMRQRDELESRNDAERTMNSLLAGLRDHEDFGSAIEGALALKAKVVGVAVYGEGGSRLYSWGETPETFEFALPREEVPGESVRKYIDDPKNDALILLFHPFRVAPPPPEGSARRSGDEEERARRDESGFLFTTMRKGEVVFLEIREPEYWVRRRLYGWLFPAIEVALAALVLFVRGILLRNADYRRRFEEQKNLVTLGTAASTLAHEIKNPLLSIKLQTRILSKTFPEEGRRELVIIDAEVDRLTALSYRVGDYLRDPRGAPRPIDAAEIAREVGARLCGRDVLVVAEALPKVLMDPERLRSVLENLVRNALESGGPEEAVSIEARAEGSRARIDVLDRGTGLGPEARSRLFDPFFTTKSRGTGIGLSVCRRFVEAAGGKISLEPRPGGGCKVGVLLPGTEAST